MSRRKLLDSLAYLVESLHLARDVGLAIAAPSYVERDDADVIARHEEVTRLLVEEGKCENAAKHVAQRGPILVVEVEDDLAIRFRLSCMGQLQLLAQRDVIVDL